MKYFKLIDILQQIAGDEKNYVKILKGIPVQTVPTQPSPVEEPQNNDLPRRPAQRTIEEPQGQGIGARRTSDGKTVTLTEQNTNTGDPHAALNAMLRNKSRTNGPNPQATLNKSTNSNDPESKTETPPESDTKTPPESETKTPMSETTVKMIDALNEIENNKTVPNASDPRKALLNSIINRTTSNGSGNKTVESAVTGPEVGSGPNAGTGRPNMSSIADLLKKGRKNLTPLEPSTTNPSTGKGNNTGIMSSLRNQVPQMNQTNKKIGQDNPFASRRASLKPESVSGEDDNDDGWLES